jgi:DNA modification methylase
VNTIQPYYDDGVCMIVNGDALDVLRSTPDDSYDLGFADPPYNYGVEYDGYADQRDDYAEWCATWFAELRRVARKVIVTPGHGNLPMWWEIQKPSGVGCWYKPGGTGSSHLGWCEWEPWLYWGDRLGGGDVIRATLNPTFKSDVGHPCPKPVLLLEQLILKTKAQSVIDPFMGSGTTLVAAKTLHRPAVGVEQSRRYCDVATARLTQETLDLGGVA